MRNLFNRITIRALVGLILCFFFHSEIGFIEKGSVDHFIRLSTKLSPSTQFYSSKAYHGKREAGTKSLTFGGKTTIEQIIKKLSDEDWKVREISLFPRGPIGEIIVIDSLVANLASEDPRIREIADRELRKLSQRGNSQTRGYQKASLYLLLKLYSRDHGKNNIKNLYLRVVGLEEILCVALKHEDKTIRLEALKRLGKFRRSNRAVRILTQELQRGERATKLNFLKELGKHATGVAVSTILNMIDDPDFAVQKYGVINTLGEMGIHSRRANQRAQLTKGLQEKIANALLKKLKDSDPEIRAASAEALGRIGHEKAIDPLIKSLADHSETVQRAQGRAWRI